MSSLPPPISPNDRPLLHKIGEYVFQDLTVDLMAGEPDLRLARLYGKRGQKQFGGDAIADCLSGGMAVAQCKCYEELDQSDVTNACDEFYEHLSHWKTHGARRFILVAACDATSPKILAEIEKQKKRFRRKGIVFETWDRIIVVQKLRLRPNLVHQYLGGSSTWVGLLCSPQEEQPASVSSSTSEADRHLLQSMLTLHLETEVMSLKEVLRRGRRGEVRARLKSFRDNSAKWGLLSRMVQAAALRLEAALELDSAGDVQQAKAYLAEACKLDPVVTVTRLETRIRLIESGPAEALKALPDKDDLETLCARGSILIVLRNVDEALRALNAAKEHDPKDADTLRLLALAYLISGEVSLAEQLLAELVSVAPEWEIVRRTKGVINYVSALSYSDLQNPASAFPEPVEWALLRRDDESLQKFTESETIFGDLLSDTDRSRDDRQILEIWRLACLANHPGRQKEALEYCSRLVGQHPCNIYALPWALARGYQVDFSRIASIAEVEIARNPSALGPVLIAIASKLYAKDGQSATELLERHRSSFEELGQIETWNYWWAMVLALSDDPNAALTFVKSLPATPHLRRVEATALRAEAIRTGDRGPLLERLTEHYVATADPLFLVELCNQYAASGNWVAVTERSTELLDRVPTTDSLYLALLADYNTRDFDRCLRRTEQYGNWFPKNRLPLDLRRMRIGCLERRGRVRLALEEAKHLLREDASPETLVSFIRLCMRFGDTQNAVLSARDLSEREDVSPEQSLSVAEQIVAYAPDLSRRLLRATAPASIPSKQLPSVLRLGFRLELERELQDLWQRGVELADEGSIVRRLQQNELAELLQQQQSVQADFVEAYELAQIPIHFLIDELRLNLPEIYWRENGSVFSPLSQAHVLIRHGKRSGADPAPIFPAATRLNLDVTSLLLVQRFQLWEALQAAFAEVRFSAHVIPFLQETLHWAGSGQPAWDRARSEVVELWQAGRIDTDPSDADRVVEFQTSEDVTSKVNPKFIADVLRLKGLLSSAEYEQAIEALGAFGKVASLGSMPETSKKVYCAGSTAVWLAVAGLLRPLSSVVTVVVDRSLLDWLQAAVTQESESRVVIEGLGRLIQFLGSELQSGQLQLIPEPARINGFEKPCSRCFADLLLFEPTGDDVVCFDDRFANGHFKREGDVQVTTMYDLLPTLLERGSLPQAKVWQLAHQLRIANLWFIPLNAPEIVYNLSQAGISEDGIIETPELRVIRQYWAACASRADLLHRGTFASNSADLGEVAFLTRSRHAVAEALACVWAEKIQSEQARFARCAWILDSLYLDITGLRRACGLTGPLEMERQLSALDAVLLFISGLSLMPVSGSHKSESWEEYVDWIWNCVFQKRCGYEPEICDAVASQMARQFRTLSQSHKDDTVDQRALGGLVYRIMQKLPEPLRVRLESDSALVTELGIETRKVITIGDFRFESEVYTTAVAHALIHGSSRLQAIRTQEEVIVRRLASGALNAIDMEFPALRLVNRLRNPFWGLLLPTLEQRRTCLRSNRYLFDLDEKAFERLLEEVLSISNDAERMERVFVAARGSAPYFYWLLGSQLRSDEPLRESELVPPSGACLLVFQGLNGEKPADRDVNHGLADSMASKLLERLEWTEALARLGGLPSPIPFSVEDEYIKSETGEQKRAIHRLLRVSRSPVRRIHALRLISRSQEDDSVFASLKRWLLRQLVRNGAELLNDAYLTMVRWVSRAVSKWSEAHEWPRYVRASIAWSHADRLFGLYVRDTTDLNWLKERFACPAGYESLIDLQEDFVIGRDVSDPSIVDQRSFLVTGLGYAFEGKEECLDLETRHLLKGAMFGAGQSIPNPTLWESPTGQVNRLSSFLSRDRLQDLDRLLGPELASPFNAEWRSDLLNQALGTITSTPDDFGSWLAFAALFRDLPLPEEVGEQIASCLAKLDLSAQAQRVRGHTEQNLLRLLTGRIAHLRSAPSRQHITSELIRLARWYASNGGNDDEVSLLVSLILAHAYPNPDKNASLLDFQQLCLSAGSCFPKLAKALRDFVGRLCTDLPVDQAAEFWPLLIQLRALA